MRMQVGVNYPWLNYGWDFGRAPAGWRPPGSRPGWRERIDGDLEHLGRLGVSVVRWFILADGLAYGSGPDAPVLDPSTRRWHFAPPQLDPEVLEDFEELLRHLADSNVGGSGPLQLLPVLIDFHFCGSGTPVVPDGWIKGGRSEAIANPAKRAAFLDRALEPFLRVSEMYRHVIYAWEVMNEPDWVTLNWRPLWRLARAVEEASMRAFLEEAQRRIRAAGFKATVGFATSRTLQLSGIASDVHQFHHYPGGRRSLIPPFTSRPAVVGEFATTVDDRWPELPFDGQHLLARLTRLEELGYDLALLWSFLSKDRHSAWSAKVEQDLERFAALRGL